MKEGKMNRPFCFLAFLFLAISSQKIIATPFTESIKRDDVSLFNEALLSNKLITEDFNLLYEKAKAGQTRILENILDSPNQIAQKKEILSYTEKASKNTFLHLSVEQNLRAILSSLLKNGADTTTKNNNRKSPFDLIKKTDKIDTKYAWIDGAIFDQEIQKQEVKLRDLLRRKETDLTEALAKKQIGKQDAKLEKQIETLLREQIKAKEDLKKTPEEKDKLKKLKKYVREKCNLPIAIKELNSILENAKKDKSISSEKPESFLKKWQEKEKKLKTKEKKDLEKITLTLNKIKAIQSLLAEAEAKAIQALLEETKAKEIRDSLEKEILASRDLLERKLETSLRKDVRVKLSLTLPASEAEMNWKEIQASQEETKAKENQAHLEETKAKEIKANLEKTKALASQKKLSEQLSPLMEDAGKILDEKVKLIEITKKEVTMLKEMDTRRDLIQQYENFLRDTESAADSFSIGIAKKGN